MTDRESQAEQLGTCDRLHWQQVPKPHLRTVKCVNWRPLTQKPTEAPTVSDELPVTDFCVCDYRPRRKCSIHPSASVENTPAVPSRGEKRPINRPCSACGDGDTGMKYHDHYPPFADEPNAALPAANFVAEVHPRPDDPSCHVCGALMVPKEFKCLSCGATSGVSPAPAGPDWVEQAALQCRRLHGANPICGHPYEMTFVRSGVPGEMVCALCALREKEQEIERFKQMAEMLRRMAEEKPEMRVISAAAILLGMLRPVTESDIKRGQQVAEVMSCLLASDGEKR